MDLFDKICLTIIALPFATGIIAFIGFYLYFVPANAYYFLNFLKDYIRLRFMHNSDEETLAWFLNEGLVRTNFTDEEILTLILDPSQLEGLINKHLLDAANWLHFYPFF